MADSIVKLVDDTSNTGSKVDLSSLTVGSNTALRQRINIADPATAAAIAGVSQFHTSDNQTLGTFYAMAMGAVNLGLNPSGNLDRLRTAAGDGLNAAGLAAAHGYLAQLQAPVTASGSPTAGSNKVITMASTTGFKVGGLALVSGGGNSEYCRINAVSAGTSITVDTLANGYTTPVVTPVLHNAMRDCSAVGEAGTLKVGAVTPGTPLGDAQTGAATAVNCTLAATANKLNWLTGFTVTGLGATAAGSIQITTTGLSNNLIFTLPIPAGVTTGVTPLRIDLPHPIPASGRNVAIVVNVPSFGSGNTVASCSAYGFQTN
jgi:hypothetical protein